MAESIRGRIAELEKNLATDGSHYPAGIKDPPRTRKEYTERLATCTEAEWHTLMTLEAMDEATCGVPED